MEPKGDCSELAKAAKLDEAKADLEVLWGLFAASSSLVAGFEVPMEPKGDTDEVFAKALGREAF